MEEETAAYELTDKPLCSQRAVEFMEGKREEVNGELVSGNSEFALGYAFLQGEIETLQDYVEELTPYHAILQEGYEDISNVPRSETVLGRVEEDMDLIARERSSRLDDLTPQGVTRRDAFDKVFEDEEYDRPVLKDTWIIMNEAEKLRELI